MSDSEETVMDIANAAVEGVANQGTVAATSELSLNSIFQLLQSIDARMRAQTEAVTASVLQVQGLASTVDECKRRLVDLEEVCVPLRDELVRRQGSTLGARADESVPVPESRSLTSSPSPSSSNTQPPTSVPVDSATKKRHSTSSARPSSPTSTTSFNSDTSLNVDVTSTSRASSLSKVTRAKLSTLPVPTLHLTPYNPVTPSPTKRKKGGPDPRPNTRNNAAARPGISHLHDPKAESQTNLASSPTEKVGNHNSKNASKKIDNSVDKASPLGSPAVGVSNDEDHFKNLIMNQSSDSDTDVEKPKLIRKESSQDTAATVDTLETVIEVPTNHQDKKESSPSDLASPNRKKLLKPGPYSRTVDGPSGSRRGRTASQDTDSDSEDVMLADLDNRITKRLNSLKEKKRQETGEEVGKNNDKSKNTIADLNGLRNCPKLSQDSEVVVSYMPRSLMRQIRLGRGHVTVTSEINKEYEKSRASLKNFNPVMIGGKKQSSSRIPSKRNKKNVDDARLESVAPLVSGSESDSNHSTLANWKPPESLFSKSISDNDGNASSDSEALFTGTGKSSEEKLARRLLISTEHEAKKKKGKGDKEESSKSDKDKKKRVSLINPDVSMSSASDVSDAPSADASKKSRKKRLDSRKERPKRNKQADSGESDSDTSKPSSSHGRTRSSKKANQKAEEKDKKKGKDGNKNVESSEDSTKKKKNSRESESDDSDFAVKPRKNKRNKAASSGSENENKESDDEDAVTLTRGKPRKAQSDNSDDSDFVVPKSKKKIMRNRLGSNSDDDDMKVNSSSGSGEESSDDDSGKRKKKSGKKRNRSSDTDDSQQKKSKKKRRRRIKDEPRSGSDSDASNRIDEDDSDIEVIANSSPGKGRKNIRKVMTDKHLDKTTRQAAKEEEERKRRVAEKQKLFNEAFVIEVEAGATLESLVLDFDKKTKKPLVSVDPSIVRQLKPHQVKGIQFMWDTCYESLANPVNGGCILAHCMGLGKTLQAVAFLHTVMTNKETKTRTALVICPLSTVGNWYKEFRMWCKDCDVQPRIHKLYEAKTPQARIHALQDWKKLGGAGIIHYDAFRALANSDAKKKSKPSKKHLQAIEECLLNPGPDIVICDEGHLLKNPSSQQSKAVMKLATQRRIVLTGTPLQNNLNEYHTMMSFVKPNLLGTLKEFRNRFVNPIANGQHKDSDEYDVKVMKKRAHVLHKLLDGCVQRLDYSVLTPYLPPKFEYAITINLSDHQKKLYMYYLQHLSANQQGVEKFVSHKLFADYQALVKVWTHPIVLTRKNQVQEPGTSDSEMGSLKDFIADDSTEESSAVTSSDDDVMEVNSDGSFSPSKSKKKVLPKKSTRANPVKEDIVVEEAPAVNDLGSAWYASFFENRQDMERMELSGKLIVLFEIIKTCEAIGDKVLVFSQFLTSLDLIEDYLEELDQQAQEKMKKDPKREVTFPPTPSDSVGRWRPNIEYFRIDGSTKTDDRQKHCDTFNHRLASKAKLFIISTRAGGLGINLTGANRVVIFDASWNPSHDLQSIFRIFRFGQHKPCYVYRLLSRGTMEEKIYNRQVVKLSLSCRVVDEQQIERHFQFDEIRNMYAYEDDTSERPIPVVPKDRLLADLLISQKDWIFSYLEHDSLLENKEEEELTEAERKAAWDEYNNESAQERMPQGLMANEPWVLSTLPKLKVVHPDKSMSELYQLCLESKRDYLALQQMFNVISHQTLDDTTKIIYEGRISDTITRLKATFGDTVNWNEHFAAKAKADAAAAIKAQQEAHFRQKLFEQQQRLMARNRMTSAVPDTTQLYQQLLQQQQPSRFPAQRLGPSTPTASQVLYERNNATLAARSAQPQNPNRGPGSSRTQSKAPQ